MGVFLTDEVLLRLRHSLACPVNVFLHRLEKSQMPSCFFGEKKKQTNKQTKQPFQLQFTFNLDNRVSIFAFNVFGFGLSFRFRKRLALDGLRKN